MADRKHKDEGKSLRNQLAAALRNIQWSYAVFWSPSTTEPGVLQWGEGYYNGDIKTRRTILTMDSKDDQLGFQRCDQLRELYESLLSVNSHPQPRRPLAALSPEDLTNVEWYYLICMSFVFNIGQGLPGISLGNGRPIWLSNAHFADTGLFCRSLLAKSAGIKTVVCFPFLSGVIELGVTESVQEDLDLIQHIKTTFLEKSSLFLSWKANSLTTLPPLVQDDDHVTLFSMSDEYSNCVHTSMTSCDGMSQTVMNPEDAFASPKTEVTNEPDLLEKDANDLIQGKTSAFDPGSNQDLHYQNVLSSVFKKSNQLIFGLSMDNLDKGSSFISWGKGGKKVAQFDKGMSQNMLKKILFEVPLMHTLHSLEPTEAIPNTNHVIAERRRREKVNERFSILKSLIPSISKVDKISILDDTIAYLKELERRVEELESCQEMAGLELKNKRRAQDMEERTSDNYGDNENEGVKSKRKAHEIDEGAQECCQLSTIEDSLIDNTITVSMVQKDILINIRCSWREGLLLEIIDTLSNLHLDSQSVQSSTIDGILSLTMKSKLRESSSLPVGMITQTLQRVIRKR